MSAARRRVTDLYPGRRRDIVARGEIARLADQIGKVVVLGPTEVLRVAERGCNGGAD